MRDKELNRREFLRLIGKGLFVAVLAACKPIPRKPEIDIAERKPITKEPTSNQLATPKIQKSTPTSIQHLRNWFVSTVGSASGDGSQEAPWDIVTALERGGNPPGSIHPGDMVTLRSGIYGNSRHKVFEIKLSGESGTPIVIRPHLGEHVIIDGTLDFYGDYIRFINSQGSEFEIRNSDWTQRDGQTKSRWLREGENNPAGPAIRFLGTTGVEIINLVIHDASEGITTQDEAAGGQVYGCLIYNCGYQSIDRGHGHGMYIQNNGPDLKSFQEVICAHNFGKGIQVFGYEPDLRDIFIEGCVTVNDDFVWFGDGIIKNATIRDCTLRGRQALDLYSGFWWPDHDEMNIQNCRIWGLTDDRFALQVGPYLNGIFVNNRVISASRLVIAYKVPHDGLRYPQIWNNNGYFGQDSEPIFQIMEPGDTEAESDYGFSGWQRETRYDVDGSQYTQGEPTGVDVEVRPNSFELGRANIIIHNWDEIDSVSVDLSEVGLQAGDNFEIKNALNYYGDPPIRGSFDEAAPLVAIDMRSDRWTYARPIGAEDTERVTWPIDEWSRDANNPFPKFGVFIIKKINRID